MAQPLVVTLPPNIHLSGGCIVRVAALDPTTGAIISGVDISNVTLQVDDVIGGTLSALATGDWAYVPGPGA